MTKIPWKCNLKLKIEIDEIEEIYKPIPTYDNYAVSNYGNVL